MAGTCYRNRKNLKKALKKAMISIGTSRIAMFKRNLPVTYNNNQSYNVDFALKNGAVGGVTMRSNVTSWIQIIIAIASILAGAIWYMGKLSQKIDSGFEKTQENIAALAEMQKGTGKKFELVAETLVKLQIDSATVKEKVTHLQHQQEKLEEKQNNNYYKKRR